jgi:hypothetical protein
MARKAHPPPRTHASEKKSGNGHSPGLGARVHSLGRAARTLRQQARSTAEDLGHAFDMRHRTRRHPYAMVAAALGVGYVLGGGLFTRTTARLLGVAGRVAALPLIRSELIGLAEAVLAASGSAEESPPAVSGSDVPSPS